MQYTSINVLILQLKVKKRFKSWNVSFREPSIRVISVFKILMNENSNVIVVLHIINLQLLFLERIFHYLRCINLYLWYHKRV